MNNSHQESTALQAVNTMAPMEVNHSATSSTALILDSHSMDKMLRLADVMASGKSTIPAHLRGSPGDCMAVVMQSVQWGMNPFAVAQKTHLVSGTLGYEAQLVAAVINNSKVVQDRFHFEWFGPWEKVIGKFIIKRGDKGEYRAPGWTLADEEGCGIKVWATIKGEEEPRFLSLLLAQARVRNSTLWADDPKQQLAYLAQKRWARLYTPDVILGVYTPDEFDAPAPRNMGHADVVAPTVPQGLLDEAETAASRGVAAYQAFWQSTSKENRKLLAGDHERLKDTAIRADKARTVDTPAPAPSPAATPDASVFTFDVVLARLDAAEAAKDVDALYIAGDLISAVPDKSEQAKLTATFNAHLLNLGG